MAEKISKGYDFEEIKKTFANFNSEYLEFKETFNSQLPILRHSNLSNDENLLLDNIENSIDIIENDCLNINSKMDVEFALELVPRINKLIETHKQMVSDVGRVKKNLPIMQIVKLYLHNAITLLGKLCTAVANFLTITVPQEAKDAKAAMVTSFNKLKKTNAKENNDYDDLWLQHEEDSPTPSPRHDG